MMFLKTAVLFGLVASICATPLPKSENGVTGVDFEIDDPEFSIDEKREAAVETPNYSILEARAAFKDTKCPDNKKTYKAADIKRAVETENRKNNPDKYGNREGGKKLFNTDKQLYKARLDSKCAPHFLPDCCSLPSLPRCGPRCLQPWQGQ